MATGPKKALTGFIVLCALVVAGGIAFFHGALMPSDTHASSEARLLEVSACESAVNANLKPDAVPAIDACLGNSQEIAERRNEPTGSGMHTITVKFDYDFTHNPVCKGKVKDTCVSTFIVYDISGPKLYKLFSVPAPANAKGVMKGITATSPRMLFEVGKHRIGVAAVSANGKESPPIDCNTIIEIKPSEAATAPPAH